MYENGKFFEVQCLEQWIRYDFEMMCEMGFCFGIENYLRYLILWFSGLMLYMFFDYFLDDFMIVVDELYVIIFQVCGMFNGDQVWKQVFVDYGFWFLLVFDNCLFCFEEFEKYMYNIVYVLVISGLYEIEYIDEMVEQIICLMGFFDLFIDVCLIEGQIDDLIGEI